ncbi:iron transporter [Streptomyces sp. WAC 06783]|uniref:IucA/IucC family protein n=1 Tax=Streptomyces sp. WAC 06783 TaxID=2203211 RepID=UPI000F74368F|nr:IucA/IucC family protein [Streptomyces sp. WAC 06783]RSO12903.1 iron transporter [Streptomyces sp. WAC 06783]
MPLAPSRTAGPDRTVPRSADEPVAHTLLNCLVREICGPERQTAVAGDHLLLRLPRCGELLRIGLRRTSLTGAHRFRGPAGQWRDGGWHELGWQELAACTQRELELRTGVRNEEFRAQVASSHAGVTAALRRAAASTDHDPRGTGPHARYLRSEQSLLFGHRFHPTPKSRTGSAADWARYAPEAGARFRLRHLAVRAGCVREEAATPTALAALDRQGEVPDGYRLLPAHPWQYAMLGAHPALRDAVRRGDLLDLGERGDAFAPTASVRTLYDGRTFLKFSLNTRITNCVRKNADYELRGAVALTHHLEPVATALAARFTGCDLLREPGYRTVDVGDRELTEGLGVIVREGLEERLRPGVTPLLAAAVADEHPTSDAQFGALLPDSGPVAALGWWDAYLSLLVPPVLAAYFDHGVVLEPHLQNVVLGVDAHGMPAQILFRDLEGTKLLPGGPHAAFLAGLPGEVARSLVYDRERGWDRVVYCLLVNHLAETAAAVADRHPALEGELWRAVRGVLRERSAAHGEPDELRALLAGAPLPAKANLLTRWGRAADREAGYVRIASPVTPGAADGGPPVRTATPVRPRSTA